jgi:hypothetical protein
MRKEKLSLEHRDGDWESNCKNTLPRYLYAKDIFHECRGLPFTMCTFPGTIYASFYKENERLIRISAWLRITTTNRVHSYTNKGE